MAIIRLRWIKISDTLPMARCWYCEAPTNHALHGTKEDYFQVWCCKKCYKKHGKLYQRTSAKEKAKKNHKRYVGNEEKQLVGGGIA